MIRSVRIPVVFVTARGDAADEERGLQLGAIDYIAKPFRLPIVRRACTTTSRWKQKNDMLGSDWLWLTD